MSRLEGQNVLITGAATGIGRLMALGAAQRGARVILWDMNREGLQKVIEQVRSQGGRVEGYICDVSSRTEVQRVGKRVLARIDHLDVLINNAGVVSGKFFWECHPMEIEKTFQVNTLAPMWITRLFLPSMMQRNDGHIVTIASASVLAATARLVDYSASKWGVFGFHEGLRVELKKNGYRIKTTIVCPFYIRTEMFAGVQSRLSWLLPILSPEKVAQKVLYAIEKEKELVIMPWHLRLVYVLRLFPVSWFDVILKWLGIHQTMDTFAGRSLKQLLSLEKKKGG